MIIKKLENKTVVWFQNHNSYVITDNMTAIVLHKIRSKINVIQIAKELSDELNIPISAAFDFVYLLKRRFKNHFKEQRKINPSKHVESVKSSRHYRVKCYRFKNKVFTVLYPNKELFNCVHYKFAHLEIDKPCRSSNYFEIVVFKGQITLKHNKKFIGRWHHNDIHLLEGKLFMQMLEVIYNKPENEWLGIFHASAIVKKNKSMLLLGNSGQGKSTALAILQRHGYYCLADDFVPISNHQKIFSFPSGISVKKGSLKTLHPMYDDLLEKEEIKNVNKTVRYLKPKVPFKRHYGCNHMVFIKYVKDSQLVVRKMSKIEAFQKLIPDSWISPLIENVTLFLEWYSDQYCYELIYSNPKDLIKATSQILNNEL